MIDFTGIEPIVEWLEQTGLLDAITALLADVSVEALFTLIALAVSVIGSLAIGGVILAVLIVIAVVALVITVTLYVLRGIGLMKIAKKLGVGHRYLAWIPYGYAYLLGECAEVSMTRNGKKTWRWSLILLFATLGLGIGRPIVQTVLSFVLAFLPLLSVSVSLLLECASAVLLVMTGYCLWCICKEFMGEVLSVLCAVFAPLCGVVEILLFVVGFLKLQPAKAVTENGAEPVVIPVEDTAHVE